MKITCEALFVITCDIVRKHLTVMPASRHTSAPSSLTSGWLSNWHGCTWSLVTNCQAPVFPLRTWITPGYQEQKEITNHLQSQSAVPWQWQGLPQNMSGVDQRTKNKVLWLQTSRILREKYLWASSKGVQNHLSRTEDFKLEGKVKSSLRAYAL